MTGTLGREVISTRQRKIAELARREPELTLTIGVTYGAFWTDGCETECTVERCLSRKSVRDFPDYF